MRVLITGGTGFLGRAIVRALVERAHEPVVFARRATTAGLPGRAIDGDVRDRDALVAAADGCEAMVHTAALVAVWRKDPREFDDVNVGGLAHAVAAARHARLRRLVYTSSFLARPPAGRDRPLAANDYQRTKAAAAAAAARARDAGTPIVSLYPGVIYGSGLLSEGNLLGRMIADHRAGRLPGLLGAEKLWSFAWVESVARAHVAALEHAAPAPDYEVGGENLPQIRPFEILRELTGTRLPRRLPFWAGRLAAFGDEARTALTGHIPQLTRATLEILRHDWPLDSSAARRDLGYEPPTLRQGMAKLIEELTGAWARRLNPTNAS